MIGKSLIYNKKLKFNGHSINFISSIENSLDLILLKMYQRFHKYDKILADFI